MEYQRRFKFPRTLELIHDFEYTGWCRRRVLKFSILSNRSVGKFLLLLIPVYIFFYLTTFVYCSPNGRWMFSISQKKIVINKYRFKKSCLKPIRGWQLINHINHEYTSSKFGNMSRIQDFSNVPDSPQMVFNLFFFFFVKLGAHGHQPWTIWCFRLFLGLGISMRWKLYATRPHLHITTIQSQIVHYLCSIWQQKLNIQLDGSKLT